MSNHNAKPQRNDEMYAMRQSGATYQQIAHRYDLCIERARQVVLRVGRLKAQAERLAAMPPAPPKGPLVGKAALEAEDLLSVRAINALCVELADLDFDDAMTAADVKAYLKTLSHQQILFMRNVGKITAREIIDWMNVPT